MTLHVPSCERVGEGGRRWPSSPDLVEILHGLPVPCTKALRCLGEAGVTVAAMTEPEPLRAARVAFRGTSHMFDFDPDGEPAFVALAHDLNGEPADLVAFRGGRIACHFGRAVALGQEQLPFGNTPPPIAIHRSPIGWLRDGRTGLVVIHPARLADLLVEFGVSVVSEDGKHTGELRKLLARPQPTIVRPSAIKQNNIAPLPQPASQEGIPRD